MPAKTPIKAEEMLMQLVPSYRTLTAYPAYIIDGTTSCWASMTNMPGNSGGASSVPYDGSMIAHNPFRNNKQLISLDRSFSEQLINYSAVFEGQKDYVLREKMKLSAEAILSCSPDKVSLELTTDGSIFYKAIINDTNIYFEHYLVEAFDDTDEALVTIYKGNENVLNYGGSLANTIAELGKALAINKIAIPEFA